MAQHNLLDIVTLNGNDKLVGLIEESLTVAPEIQNFPARTIRGLSYYTSVRTSLPTSGFRNANEGQAATKSAFEKRLVETFIIDTQVIVDKAVADAYEDGSEALRAIESVGVTKSTFKTLGKQIWYGPGTTNNSNGDAKGFLGAIDSHDSTNMVVDAAGTTAGTGSSVWGVKYGPQNAQLVLGNGGTFDLSPFATQQVVSTGSSYYTAYVAALTAYPGLQIGNRYCVGRIKKLTADSGKTLTDILIAQLLEKFMTYLGEMPDALYMSPRSLRQLQASRTATTTTGQPAPFPTESFGVPIVVTNQILNTEHLSL